MLKHVGRHNNRKIVLLFRQVPGEDHMCLVTYSDQLPQLVHDELMKTLESQVGQQSENFADALFRQTLPDGRNALEVLHKEGLIKKVQSNQVIVTPNANSSVRLDELNSILNEMAKGDEAVKRLAELDQNRGLVSPKNDLKVDTTTLNESIEQQALESQGIPAITEAGVLSDADIAKSQRDQATRMRQDAAKLLEEATRLEGEAEVLSPTVAVKSTRGRKPRAATQGTERASTTKTKGVRDGSAKKAVKA